MTITNSKVKCVIFDKDGVLVDFTSMWLPWAENTVQLINEATAQDLTHDIYRTLGICPHTKKVGPGALAEKTLPLIRGDMMQMLKGKGYQHHEAEHISHRCVLEESQSGRICSIVDLPPIFEELNNLGIHTAVCTSDSRRQTDKQLEILGVAEYAAVVMCGNDPGVKPKPDPHCALTICKQLGIEPHEAIMVGDTATDLKMGRAAGLRASVAVLSGIGNRDTLKHWADHYINDVSELIPLILDELHGEGSKRG